MPEDRLVLGPAAKAGRNGSCPCGSGKKYKKCCLAKDQANSARHSSAASPPPSVAASPRADSLLKKLEMAGRSTAPARATKAPEPPRPKDPVVERADRRWEEFESHADEGRIAIFIETLEDAELMTDSMAYEMLERLHADAMQRGDRSRYPELVGALRERRPEVYEQSAHYYLSTCVWDALAENRLKAADTVTRDLAARAGANIDIFNRVVEALAYHGQLKVLVEAYRIGLPSVKSTKDIMAWAVSSFMYAGADYEIFDYLEHTSSPDPADPALLDRVQFFVEEPGEDYLRDFISDLAGRSGREWRVEDFALRPSRKRARDEWGDDDGRESKDPAAINLSRLLTEFVGSMRRQEGVPFPRGELVRQELYSYFSKRHHGKLDPQPSMFDQVMRPDLKLPKPARPTHPLCPEPVTLDVFLGGLMGIFNGRHHTAAAVFQAIPAWLRFLESRRLIDAEVRRTVADELLPLHATLSKVWRDYPDDPTLDYDGRSWPADIANEKGDKSN
jgi:SEC-C motif